MRSERWRFDIIMMIKRRMGRKYCVKEYRRQEKYAFPLAIHNAYCQGKKSGKRVSTGSVPPKLRIETKHAGFAYSLFCLTKQRGLFCKTLHIGLQNTGFQIVRRWVLGNDDSYTDAPMSGSPLASFTIPLHASVCDVLANWA